MDKTVVTSLSKSNNQFICHLSNKKQCVIQTSENNLLFQKVSNSSKPQCSSKFNNFQSAVSSSYFTTNTKCQGTTGFFCSPQSGGFLCTGITSSDIPELTRSTNMSVMNKLKKLGINKATAVGIGVGAGIVGVAGVVGISASIARRLSAKSYTQLSDIDDDNELIDGSKYQYVKGQLYKLGSDDNYYPMKNYDNLINKLTGSNKKNDNVFDDIISSEDDDL